MKRRGFIPLSSFEPKVINGIKYCLNCDKIIVKGSGRSKYCSGECADDFWAKHNWQGLRNRFLKKKDYKCIKCGLQIKEYTFDENDKPIDWLIVDHIIAIELGGAEFDESNLQVLCRNCNKSKTAMDMKNIAKQRKYKRILIPTQKTLTSVANG
jgi:5-methylcytosine-specific restriction endonuclease McrA